MSEKNKKMNEIQNKFCKRSIQYYKTKAQSTMVYCEILAD